MVDYHRVVITGAGAVSPYGAGVDTLVENLLNNVGAVQFVQELKDTPFINSFVACKVPEIDFTFIPRQYRRYMTKMSLYAVMACQEALKNASIEKPSDDTALYIGSTMSSISSWLEFTKKYFDKELNMVKTMAVFQVLNHSPLANVAQALDMKGPGYFVSNACASSLTNIGLAYQMIKAGFIKRALCGGTEEYHPIFTGCFSILNAASTNFNDNPQKASRPFDKDRCGIVCSEGCAMLYIESLESALERKANILAEIKGFATNTETKNIAHPSRDSMQQCIQMALNDAKLKTTDIDLVNAHATSTVAGDIEEVSAIGNVFGKDIKVNSLKGHIGHSMAACGSMELISIMKMMLAGKVAGTLNLDNIDEQCNVVNHIRNTQEIKINNFVKNSFALGGTNASIVIGRYN